MSLVTQCLMLSQCRLILRRAHSRPFLRRAWIWIVAFIVLGAFAFLYVMSDSRLVTAGATPGYRGAAQDTGYLADGYANGVGVAWQMNAADAGLDRIDDYAAATDAST